MKKKIAVFPGSFDPITLGHCDIIIRGLKLFDKIIIAIGNNFSKKNMFSIKKRKKWILETFEKISDKKIIIDSFNGSTISFCKEKKIKFLLRGIRNQIDFEFEKNMLFVNNKLEKKYKVETIFLFSSQKRSHINSYIVRNIIRNGGDYTLFVPSPVRIK